MLKAMAIGYARKRPMHKRNAVQLRLAFSAAAIGAVLAAATFSGARRAGSLVDGSRNRTDSRWVDFDDQEPGWRESWNTSITV